MHDQLLDEVAAHRAGARDELWRRFEAAVVDHMQVEERHLLSAFVETHPREAAELLAEHRRLRRTLARLRAELSVPLLKKFITSFTAHARREDPLLYAWADRDVDGDTQAAIARELSDRDKAASLGP